MELNFFAQNKINKIEHHIMEFWVESRIFELYGLWQKVIISNDVVLQFLWLKVSSFFFFTCHNQRWSRRHKARGQGHKKILRPRTQAQIFFRRSQKKKVFKKIFQAKKVFKNFFSGDPQLRKTRKGLSKVSATFLVFSNKISMVQKIVLSLSPKTGQYSRTRGFEAKDIKMCPRGLHL